MKLPIELIDFDKLFKDHIEKMWGGLELESVKYFIETGKINGSFRLRMISMMKAYEYQLESQPETIEPDKGKWSDEDTALFAELMEVLQECGQYVMAGALETWLRDKPTPSPEKQEEELPEETMNELLKLGEEIENNYQGMLEDYNSTPKPDGMQGEKEELTIEIAREMIAELQYEVKCLKEDKKVFQNVIDIQAKQLGMPKEYPQPTPSPEKQEQGFAAFEDIPINKWPSNPTVRSAEELIEEIGNSYLINGYSPNSSEKEFIRYGARKAFEQIAQFKAPDITEGEIIEAASKHSVGPERDWFTAALVKSNSFISGVQWALNKLQSHPTTQPQASKDRSKGLAKWNDSKSFPKSAYKYFVIRYVYPENNGWEYDVIHTSKIPVHLTSKTWQWLSEFNEPYDWSPSPQPLTRIRKDNIL